MPTKATHKIDRESHERYVAAAQYAMFRYQMIEEALKTYIFHAHEVVQSRLPSEITFDYKVSEYESMPLERLLSVFAKFTHNKPLLKQLHGLREMRNYVAHRAFFYATLSATSDRLNFSEEFAKVQKALSMADVAADALLDEVDSIAALAQRMKGESGKT